MVKSGPAAPVHPLNWNEKLRVCQLKVPFDGMYWLVYQKVQSSLGSMDMLV